MFKYLLLAFCMLACLTPGKAQQNDDPAREEFIEYMAQFKTPKYVQKGAEFKGGAGALYDYLQSHIVYPEDARKEGLSAQVFVNFLIDWKTGLPQKVKVVQSSNKIFESETVRLIKSMPAWTPAKQGEGNVGMFITIPVYFHLD
jgi:TonB family protein